MKNFLTGFLLASISFPSLAHAQSYVGNRFCEFTSPTSNSYKFPCKVTTDKALRISRIVNTKNGQSYTVYRFGSQESRRQGAWVNHKDFSNCIKLNDGYPPESDDPQICTIWNGQRGDG